MTVKVSIEELKQKMQDDLNVEIARVDNQIINLKKRKIDLVSVYKQTILKINSAFGLDASGRPKSLPVKKKRHLAKDKQQHISATRGMRLAELREYADQYGLKVNTLRGWHTKLRLEPDNQQRHMSTKNGKRVTTPTMQPILDNLQGGKRLLSELAEQIGKPKNEIKRVVETLISRSLVKRSIGGSHKNPSYELAKI